MKEAIQRLNGLYVGQLTLDEMLLFEAAVKAGIAYPSYERGLGMIMGLAKVRIR